MCPAACSQNETPDLVSDPNPVPRLSPFSVPNCFPGEDLSPKVPLGATAADMRHRWPPAAVLETTWNDPFMSVCRERVASFVLHDVGRTTLFGWGWVARFFFSKQPLPPFKVPLSPPQASPCNLKANPVQAARGGDGWVCWIPPPPGGGVGGGLSSISWRVFLYFCCQNFLYLKVVPSLDHWGGQRGWVDPLPKVFFNP